MSCAIQALVVALTFTQSWRLRFIVIPACVWQHIVSLCWLFMPGGIHCITVYVSARVRPRGRRIVRHNAGDPCSDVTKSVRIMLAYEQNPPPLQMHVCAFVLPVHRYGPDRTNERTPTEARRWTRPTTYNSLARARFEQSERVAGAHVVNVMWGRGWRRPR